MAVTPLVIRPTLRLCFAAGRRCAAHKAHFARRKIGREHKGPPGVLAKIRSHKAGFLPGFPAIGGDFNALHGYCAAHRNAVNQVAALMGFLQGSGNPGFDVHFPHGRLFRCAGFAHVPDTVAGSLDLGIGFLVGERNPFDVLDVVDPVIPRNDHPQRTAVRQWQGLIVHGPGENGGFQCPRWHRALHDDGFRVKPGGQLFAAGVRNKAHAILNAAEFLDHILEGHPGPHHTSSCADRPLGSAGTMGEKRAAVPGALKHRGNRGDVHVLELGQGKAAGVPYSFNRHFPGIGVLDDVHGWRRQVVANEQSV